MIIDHKISLVTPKLAPPLINEVDLRLRWILAIEALVIPLRSTTSIGCARKFDALGERIETVVDRLDAGDDRVAVLVHTCLQIGRDLDGRVAQ